MNATKPNPQDHYEGLAAQAELQRWQGKFLTPQNGCGLHHTTLGDAEVVIEYEYEPAEAQTRDHPGCSESVAVIQVLINGCMVDASVIDSDVVSRWETEISESLASDADADRCDVDDRQSEDWAADRASDRYQRDIDARHG